MGGITGAADRDGLSAADAYFHTVHAKQRIQPATGVAVASSSSHAAAKICEDSANGVVRALSIPIVPTNHMAGFSIALLKFNHSSERYDVCMFALYLR